MIGFVDREGTGKKESAGAVRAEMDFGEIAEAMGISRQRVQQLYSQAMRKLARVDWAKVKADAAAREFATPSRSSRHARRGCC